MKTAWVFDGQDYVAFTKDSDILPSVNISYSKVKDANFALTKIHDEILVDVFIGGQHHKTLRFRLCQIHDEPTHF